MSTRFKVAAGVVVAMVLVVGLFAGLAFADDPTPTATPTPQTLAQTFLSKLAAKLGISQDTLQQGIVSTEKEMVDEAQQAGRITQQQADNLKQRIDESQGISDFGLGGRMRAQGWSRGFMKGFKLGAVDIAGFLGITPQQLEAEFESGKSLAQVAEVHGKTRDQLKTYIHDQVKAKLDQAVSSKQITQQQAGSYLANLDQKLDSMIDQQEGPRMRGLGRLKHGMQNGNGNQNRVPAGMSEL